MYIILEFKDKTEIRIYVNDMKTEQEIFDKESEVAFVRFEG